MSLTPHLAGPVRFDDLFEPEPEAAGSVPASIDKKVEYFRESLRRAEARMAKFRRAWDKRDKEIESLKKAFEQERANADKFHHDLESTLAIGHQLEDQLAQVKKDYAAYAKNASRALEAKEAGLAQVTALYRAQLDAVHERDLHITALNDDLDQARAEVADLEVELNSASKHSSAAHDGTIEKLQRELRNMEANARALEAELRVKTKQLADEKKWPSRR